MKTYYNHFQSARRYRIKVLLFRLTQLNNLFILTDSDIQEIENINKVLQREYHLFNMLMQRDIDYKTFINMFR